MSTRDLEKLIHKKTGMTEQRFNKNFTKLKILEKVREILKKQSYNQ